MTPTIDSDVAPCVDCAKPVNDFGVQCDKCERYTHLLCLVKLPPMPVSQVTRTLDILQTFASLPGVEYRCPTCPEGQDMTAAPASQPPEEDHRRSEPQKEQKRVSASSMVVFHGASHPLSNFFLTECPLVDEDESAREYVCAEQRYQVKKALFHGKKELAEKIQTAKTGGEAKRLAKSIKIAPEWCEESENIMYECLILKAKASRSFLSTLRACESKQIVHSTPYPGSDYVWTSGLDAENSKSCGGVFPGNNLLGKLLTRLLDQIKTGDDASLLHNKKFSNPLPRGQTFNKNSTVQPVTAKRTRMSGCEICGMSNHSTTECRHRRRFPHGIPCAFCGHLGHKYRLCKQKPRGWAPHDTSSLSPPPRPLFQGRSNFYPTYNFSPMQDPHVFHPFLNYNHGMYPSANFSGRNVGETQQFLR